MKKVSIRQRLYAAYLSFFILYAHMGAHTAHADTSILVSFPNPLKTGDTLYDFIKLVINEIIIPVGGVLSVVFIIFAGFTFVTAQGSETKIKTAKNSLLFGIIGAAIILGAWAIANAIQGTINQLTPP